MVIAGLVGTLGLTITMLAGTALGLGRLNFPMLLGSMFAPPGPQALGLGLPWHFLNGVLFAAAYALVFAGLGMTRSAGLGLALGLLHFLVGGLLLAQAGRVHPRIRQGHMPTPGAFGARYGPRVVLVLLAGHLAYGVMVGALL